MAAVTYDSAMVRVFADEGGYTNDLHDPGGPTNWGITIFDARKYWKKDATADDVKRMPKSVASEIYRLRYAAPLRYNDLPAGFDYSVLDAGINSGLGRAIPWAARAANAKQTTIDGVVIAAKAETDQVAMIKRLWGIRLAFLHGLTNWKHFGGGWGRRCAQGEAAAVRMWLTMGAQLPLSETKKRLQTESTIAKKQSTNAGTGAAGSGSAGTIAGTTMFDWSHMTMGMKVVAAVLVAGLIVTAVMFIRKAIFHSQRSEAYANA